MKFNNLTKSIGNCARFALVGGLILIVAAAGFAETAATANAGRLAGVWQLKRTVAEKGARRGALILPVRETPESLILAVEDATNEITINEGFKEFIQTQTLPTNGQAVTQNVQQIGKVSTTAVWAKGRLIIEVVTPRGDKLVETFDLSADQKQLHVSLYYTTFGSSRTVKVRRIYQRVAEIDQAETAQLGITDYPL